MTPTFWGRVQTRFAVTTIVGIPIAFVVSLYLNNTKTLGSVFFVFLLTGVFWDVVYDFLQKRRWDSDWPMIFVLITGAIEGLCLFLVLSLLFSVLPISFTIMYTIVWLSMMAAQYIFLPIFFPRRRFRGGRFV